MKIQNKIDSLNLGSGACQNQHQNHNSRNDKEIDQLKFSMKDLEEKSNEKTKTINRLQLEFDSIQQKINILCENHGSTQKTL